MHVIHSNKASEATKLVSVVSSVWPHDKLPLRHNDLGVTDFPCRQFYFVCLTKQV